MLWSSCERVIAMNQDHAGIKIGIKDVVCGMDVSSDSEYHHQHGDDRYYFCSESCLRNFMANPEQYLGQKPSPSGPGGEEAVIYTCPMHPEVRQSSPGSCPKCGMALEPFATPAQEENPELVGMTRRLWVSAILAAPVFLLAMTADLFPSLLPAALSMRTIQWIQFALATPVVLCRGSLLCLVGEL
jgi:Cu+-exporting ATPase